MESLRFSLSAAASLSVWSWQAPHLVHRLGELRPRRHCYCTNRRVQQKHTGMPLDAPTVHLAASVGSVFAAQRTRMCWSRIWHSAWWGKLRPRVLEWSRARACVSICRSACPKRADRHTASWGALCWRRQDSSSATDWGQIISAHLTSLFRDSVIVISRFVGNLVDLN